MTTFRSQRGGVMVMLLGLTAALAIMAITLVMVMGNTQANTADDRVREKSFTVAEAALDAGMATLATQWPETAAQAPSFDPVASGFRGQFSTAEFPDPASGAFASAQYYDDLTPIDTNIHYDSNGNDIMVLAAQGNVHDRSSRIQVKVERTYFDAQLPRGVAVYASADIQSNGHGNNPKIHMGTPPPGGTGTVYGGGTIDYNGGSDSVFDNSYYTSVTGAAVPPLDSFFSQTLVDQIVQLAQVNDRYFTSVAAAKASPADPEWSPNGGMSGLCVIRASAGAAGTPVPLGDAANSFENPGLMLVLGGANVEIKGNQSYYGVVYCEGAVARANGTPDLYGMIICKGDVDLRGTADIIYDDRCIVNLLQKWTLTVKLVDNTWREVQPQ